MKVETRVTLLQRAAKVPENAADSKLHDSLVHQADLSMLSGKKLRELASVGSSEPQS